MTVEELIRVLEHQDPKAVVHVILSRVMDYGTLVKWVELSKERIEIDQGFDTYPGNVYLGEEDK